MGPALEVTKASAPPRPPERNAHLGELLRRITEDVKTIGRDELALARLELAQVLKASAADAGTIVLAGVVALIGLGLLCTTAVVALAPWLPALWARMLLMSGVYVVLGGAFAVVFGKRLKLDVAPGLPRTRSEARRTATALQKEVRRG